MELAFIGFGEAGSAMAKGLNEEGINNIKAFDAGVNNKKFSKTLKQKAIDAGVELLKEQKDLFSNSNVIISVVPSKFSLNIVENSLPFIDQEKNLLYIDLTTAEPSEKMKIQELLAKKNVLFVDGAMMGRLITNHHKVPILASGNGVDKFQKLFWPYNMNISKVSDTPGDATSIKLIRSIFMKGYAALCIEMLEAARIQGVENTVINGIGNSLDSKSFKEIMNLFVTGTAVHSERRISELTGTLEVMKTMRIDHTMTAAVIEKLEKFNEMGLAKHFGSAAPDSWTEVIDIIIEDNY